MKSRRDEYDEKGFVIVRGVLDPQVDLEPVRQEYDALADRRAAELKAAGRVTSYDSEAPVESKLLQLMAQTHGDCFQSLDITLPLEDQIRPNTPMHLGPEVFALLRNSKLLDAIEGFIGAEIYSVPVQHMRIKPPQHQISDKTKAHTLTLTGQTAWHQDLVVVTEEAAKTDMISVWLPLNRAAVENGCLMIAPGSHREGLVHHCDEPSFQGVPDKAIGVEPLPLPVEVGDVIFIHPLMLHASLPNKSTRGRWSLDLRYCPVGQPTGRPWFPGFVARSRANPELELKDASVWAESWRSARTALADKPRPSFHHYMPPGHPLCA